MLDTEWQRCLYLVSCHFWKFILPCVYVGVLRSHRDLSTLAHRMSDCEMEGILLIKLFMLLLSSPQITTSVCISRKTAACRGVEATNSKRGTSLDDVARIHSSISDTSLQKDCQGSRQVTTKYSDTFCLRLCCLRDYFHQGSDENVG